MNESCGCSRSPMPQTPSASRVAPSRRPKLSTLQSLFCRLWHRHLKLEHVNQQAVSSDHAVGTVRATINTHKASHGPAAFRKRNQQRPRPKRGWRSCEVDISDNRARIRQQTALLAGNPGQGITALLQLPKHSKRCSTPRTPTTTSQAAVAGSFKPRESSPETGNANNNASGSGLRQLQAKGSCPETGSCAAGGQR